MFALLTALGACLLALFCSRVLGVRLQEHDVQLNRSWRDWRPANPFRYPWTVAREFADKMQHRTRLKPE